MKQSTYLALAFAVALAVLLSIGGCAQMFTAKTTVHYEERRPDGTVIIADYSSDKDQVGLDAKLGKEPSIKVDKASTAEAVIAAVLQTQTKLLGMIEALTTKAGALGAGS